MKHFDPTPHRNDRIAVRVATDGECDDFVIQDHVQAFLRALLCMATFRRVDKGLREAARRAGTVLLDSHGNPASIVGLSDDDYFRFGYWVRDWAAERRDGIARRNRSETLERRRYLITLLRMAWPREMTTLGRSLEQLAVERTSHHPPKPWEL